MQFSIQQIYQRFRIEGEFLDAERVGMGHINDTFRVSFRKDGKHTRYILQRINHHVFRDPAAMQENIRRVTEHCRMKLREVGVCDLERRTLTLIPAIDDRPYHVDQDGNYWRVYLNIDGAKAYETLQLSQQAYHAAREFGRFQCMLADLPEPPLHETIPAFHHGPTRFAQLKQAIDKDAYNRAKKCRETIDWALRHKELIDVFPRLAGTSEMPWRVTHNDTKINNVLLDDKTGEGLCVIDLDTVMPGLALYDFGDLARSTLSPAPEDEQNLSKVQARLDVFEALARGYLETAGEMLTSTECEHLVISCKVMTFIIGMRFLTDYLNGDVYFRISRHAQNLDRARAQLQLIEEIEKNEEPMCKIAEKK